MALRFIGIASNGPASAKIYYDANLAEFRVKLFRDGAYIVEADYFTDERQDAEETARHMCGLPAREDAL